MKSKKTNFDQNDAIFLRYLNKNFSLETFFGICSRFNVDTF